MKHELNIQIVNQLRTRNGHPQVMIDPKRKDKYPMFKIRVFISGTPDDLDQIQEVYYKLHPTFPNPMRVASNRDNNFELVTWAWGEFNMDVEIITKKGKSISRSHRFEFSDLVKEAGDNGISFFNVTTQKYMKLKK